METNNIIWLQVRDIKYRRTPCFQIVKVDRESNPYILYIQMTTKDSNKIPIQASKSLGIVFCTGKKIDPDNGDYLKYSINPIPTMTHL